MSQQDSPPNLKPQPLIEPAQVQSILRHIYTAAGAVTTMLVFLGWSQGDATAIGAAVHAIGDGIASVIAGASSLVMLITPIYAAWKRSRKQMVKDVDALPGVAGVITQPTREGVQLANAVPSNTVVPAGTAQAAEVASK